MTMTLVWPILIGREHRRSLKGHRLARELEQHGHLFTQINAVQYILQGNITSSKLMDTNQNCWNIYVLKDYNPSKASPSRGWFDKVNIYHWLVCKQLKLHHCIYLQCTHCMYHPQFITLTVLIQEWKKVELLQKTYTAKHESDLQSAIKTTVSWFLSEYSS